MLVLHEGLIPSSKAYKICVLNNVEDIKILDIIFFIYLKLMVYFCIFLFSTMLIVKNSYLCTVTELQFIQN